MGFDVKNTTKWGPMDWLCPHRCRGCGQLGRLICERCKNDILSENLAFRRDFDDLLVVGKREKLLGEIIKEYKYGPVRAFGEALAGLLAEVLIPELAREENVVLVPLPTIGRHIRARGFDHMRLIGKKMAKIGGWRCEMVLGRVNNAVQVGKTREERIEQAKTAYKAEGRLDSNRTYVLLDDVWTTGASMRAAETALRLAGAKKIKKLVLAVSEDD